MLSDDPKVTKIKAELDELRAEVNKLKADAEKQTAETRMRFDQYLGSLDRKSTRIGEKLESLRDSSGDAMDDIRLGLRDAMQRLAIARKAAQARFH